MAWSWLMSNFRLRLLAPTPRRSLSSSRMAHLRVLMDSRTRLPIAPSTAPRASRLKIPTFTPLASLAAQTPVPTSRLRAQATRTSLCMPCRATILPPRPTFLGAGGPSTLVRAQKTPITTSRQLAPLSSRRSSKRSREALSRLVTRQKSMTVLASMSPATLRSPISWATLCRSTTLRPSCITARRLKNRQRKLWATSTPTHLRVLPRTWSSPFSMPKRASPRPAIS